MKINKVYGRWIVFFFYNFFLMLYTLRLIWSVILMSGTIFLKLCGPWLYSVFQRCGGFLTGSHLHSCFMFFFPPIFCYSKLFLITEWKKKGIMNNTDNDYLTSNTMKCARCIIYKRLFPCIQTSTHFVPEIYYKNCISFFMRIFIKR